MGLVFIHVSASAAFLVGAGLLAHAQTFSSLARTAAPFAADQGRIAAPYRTFVYRFFTVIAFGAAFNAGWRLTHQWWIGVLTVPLILLIMPRILAPALALRWRQRGADVRSLMRRRWWMPVAALIAFQIVDVIGSVDYRPFG